MDRLAPSRRPVGRNAGTQRWRDLLFVHYEVDPRELQLLLPKGLEVDTFEGRAFVGIVPFRMQRIAPPFYPSVLGLNFLEINVRTYVHRGGDAPGVHFFSLEASNMLAVRVARRFWGLPYFDAKMSVTSDAAGERDYRSSRVEDGAFVHARYHTGQVMSPARLGTFDHFLLERYLLYVERKGVLHVGQVHHTPYPRCDVELTTFDESLVRAAGLHRRGGLPDYVHASPGVDVEVFSVRPVV